MEAAGNSIYVFNSKLKNDWNHLLIGGNLSLAISPEAHEKYQIFTTQKIAYIMIKISFLGIKNITASDYHVRYAFHTWVNPHSIVSWMSINSLRKTGATSKVLSDCQKSRTHNHLVRKPTLNHLAKLTWKLSSKKLKDFCKYWHLEISLIKLKVWMLVKKKKLC